MPLVAVFLDTWVLSLVTHRADKSQEAADCQQWVVDLLAADVTVHVPEITDYELRREMVLNGNQSGLARLNAFNLAAGGRYVALSTNSMLKASELWARVRKAGKTTAAKEALDGDALLAAQVFTWCDLRKVDPASVIVATSNVKHLIGFENAPGVSLRAGVWRDIKPEEGS